MEVPVFGDPFPIGNLGGLARHSEQGYRMAAYLLVGHSISATTCQMQVASFQAIHQSQGHTTAAQDAYQRVS